MDAAGNAYLTGKFSDNAFKITSSTPDCNGNGIPDECDVEYSNIGVFVGQLLAETPDPVLVCMFDQNGDATLDGTDIRGFVDRLLGGG